MDSLIESLRNLGPARLAMMLLTFFGLLIFFIFIAVRSSAPAMSLLYGDLTSNDATEIAAKLDASNIAYDIGENGTRISVMQKNVAKARLLLAQEGLPRKGSMGYEIFDQKQSYGTTSFQQNINALRALEGELARTIGTIEQVKNARVHLVLPQRELFGREQQEPSASVFLNVRNQAGLGSEQVEAIQQLVAAAVPKLKASRVAVIDQTGALLARGEDDTRGAAARNASDMKSAYETKLTHAVEEMVGRVVGYGKVRANISADMNFDVVTRNSETYDPEQQVVRSSQTTSEDSEDNTAQPNSPVSVQNNLPGLSGTAPGATPAGIKSNRTEETTNYDIGKTVESLTRESGQVQKLSIAVLVDGSYAPDTSVKKPKDAKDDWQPPRKYAPRSDQEIQQITALVKSAVGFDEDRGDTVEVVNMQFAENTFTEGPVATDTIMGFPKASLLATAETIALSVVAVLIVLLVLRPLATHFASGGQRRNAGYDGDTSMLPAGAQQGQLAGPGNIGMLTGAAGGNTELESMIDMSSVEGKVKASSVQKISELVTNHPNETVSVIRQWMSQEN
ncbi:MAG: flagellar basal-body MS-ring/collar protein FliF [Alphaproteobacteria bacterium]